jgi:hypothetical protein
MTLETVLPAGDRRLWGKGWLQDASWLGLGMFTCDNVALHGAFTGRRRIVGKWLSGLRMKIVQGHNGKVEVKLRAFAYNPPQNHDKSVLIRIEILKEASVAGTGTIGPFTAEDDGNGDDHDEVTFFFDPDWLQQNPSPRMRLMVSTMDI